MNEYWNDVVVCIDENGLKQRESIADVDCEEDVLAQGRILSKGDDTARSEGVTNRKFSRISWRMTDRCMMQKLPKELQFSCLLR